ncbi:MAG: 30S ribosome-binding factor RbfA [Acidobacteria bacterium]|nr:30S ribosome-binding factor RbfA [Acidobacteriota bacterium]
MSRHKRHDRGKRLSELLREIIATSLERIEDERIAWVSVTEVHTDAELDTAKVYVTSLEPESMAESLEALSDHRKTIQAEIGRQARLRRVPRLEFHEDDVLESASRVEQILRDLALDENPSLDDGA